MITYRVTVDDRGTRWWFLNGKFHRLDGPAIEEANGDRMWWLNGKYHREDGPAVEWANGGRIWYLNGLRHREDGPAIEWANGNCEWWLNGEELSEEEHRRQTQTSPGNGKVVEIDGIKYTLTAVE